MWWIDNTSHEQSASWWQRGANGLQYPTLVQLLRPHVINAAAEYPRVGGSIPVSAKSCSVGLKVHSGRMV